jgi:hypothetical protein
MSETLIQLKESLRRGEKRELARRLNTRPSKIADALDGFVKDVDFLSRLQAEIEKIIKERQPLTA